MRLLLLRGGSTHYLHIKAGSAWIVISRHGINTTWAQPTRTEPVVSLVKVCLVIAALALLV